MLWGGSEIRPEATGYGLIYFTETVLNARGESVRGQRCAISGSGNVSEFTAEKLFELGARVMSFSDSGGVVIEPNGFTEKQFEHVREIKRNRGRISEYTKFSKTCKFVKDGRPWKNIDEIDLAFPCATENEVCLSSVCLGMSGCGCGCR